MHQIETYTMTYACGHTAAKQVEHWGDQPYGDRTTGALCAACEKKREKKNAKIMRIHGKAIKSIVNAAHPLREAVQTADGKRVVAGCTYTPATLQAALERGDAMPPATHDLYGKRTNGRITYSAAVAEYGQEAVAAAMELGRVYLDDVPNVPAGRSFDPKNATPKSRLVANGVAIG